MSESSQHDAYAGSGGGQQLDPTTIQLESVATRMALERATEWFRIHTDQRLKLFNFYIVLYTAAVAGFAAATKDKVLFLQLGIAIVTLVVTHVFRKLDERSSMEISDAVTVLNHIEGIIATGTGNPDVRVASATRHKTRPSYTKNFFLMFIVGYMTVGGFMLAALSAAFDSNIDVRTPGNGRTAYETSEQHCHQSLDFRNGR